MWRHEIHSSASRLFVSSILTICVVALVLGTCNIYPTPTPTVTPASTPTPTPAPTLTQQEAITIVQYWLRDRTYQGTEFYEQWVPDRTYTERHGPYAETSYTIGHHVTKTRPVQKPCPSWSDRTWTATYDPVAMAWEIETVAKDGYGAYKYVVFDRTRLVFSRQVSC